MNVINKDQLRISLHSDHADRQHELHAILKIIPNVLPLPYSGGRYGKEGSAVVGFGDTLPQTIWCISPSLREGDYEGLLRCSLWSGLQRCASNEFLTVAILLEPEYGRILSAKSLVKVTVETVISFAGKVGGVNEVRLIAEDNALFRHTATLLAAYGNAGDHDCHQLSVS